VATPGPAAPRILASVVGSYPTPAWLAAPPSASALRDAVMVVLETQELAGLDLISDGELSRFDVDHPETNGMIEWFTSRLDGIAATLTRQEPARFRGLRPGLGLGAVDVKDLEIERPDVVARRIEAAVAAPGADAVRWVHPDCGLWMLPRSVADGKLHPLVAGRDLFAGTA